ncbi:MAG: hypothetical protein EOO50_02780 [Flavobacterium sp.]|uniref:hypothetical protein n=1 Tax=Flavobacterium sp. TaxID=239 RepID=UPI001208179B|nr:hypothetical protein [Flavobacterium sp.]RZJ68028.1 MAG: hypothetical protein EOO50_02780 [Flavobacterium sp.]
MLTVFTGSYNKRLSGKVNGLQPFILSDKSIIVTKKSVNRFFGHTGKSDWLNEYMQGFSRYGLGATGLLDKLSNPVLFKTEKKSGFPTIEEGYELKTLIATCEFLLFARQEGFLSVIELKIAKIAENILSDNNQSPFAHQIAELTGFNLLKWKAQQKIFETLQEKQKEKAHIWVSALSDEFWDFLSEQLNVDWKKIINNPIPSAKFTHDWIFSRLPENTMEFMRAESPKRIYRSKKGPQNNQNPGLSSFVNQLVGFYGVCDQNLSILDQLLSKSHPKLRTVLLPEEAQKPELSPFSQQLREAVLKK